MAVSPLVAQVLQSDNRELSLLAARGLLPLAPEELVGLQVHLAAAEDSEVARAASEALIGTEARVLVPYLAHDAPGEVLRWFATHSANREVIATVLQRRDVPPDVLLRLAPRLPADLQEILLLRQDRIAEGPELLAALESNPELTSYARRRIREYREHLLHGGEPAAVVEPAAEPEELDPLEDPEVQQALAEARQQEGDGEIEERTGLNEGQVRLLPVNVRLKLARGAPKTLRQVLVRDNSSLVALTVVQANPLVEQEVEQYAKMRNVVSEVLDYLGKHRQWSAKYNIALALATNPRTPLPVALQMLNKVSVRELRKIARDRNLPEAVRAAAQRLHRVKSQ